MGWIHKSEILVFGQMARRYGMLCFIVFVLVVVGGSDSQNSENQDSESAEKIKAPNFVLSNFNGRLIHREQFKEKIVVLEWMHCECTFIKAHYNDDVKTMLDLQKKYADQDVVWISVNSTNTATLKENKKWALEHHLQYVLLDNSGRVGRAYKAERSPHIFIVDRQGYIAYQGAIDNAPLGFLYEEKYVNYIDLALGELIAGKPLSIPQTPPYGCPIKYAKLEED